MGARTIDEHGRHLYGGHSLRTGGAHLLAAHGLDQVQIQALARWHSPMLGHYAGLAPLLSITSEYNRRLPCSTEYGSTDTASSSKRAKQYCTVQPGAVQAIIAQLASMAGKIDQLIAKERSLELADETRDERTSSDKYILNIDSARWHIAAESSGLAPHTFKAACGWKYGCANHHIAKQLPASAKGKILCERCMPIKKSEAQLREASAADCSSASSGSSEE